MLWSMEIDTYAIFIHFETRAAYVCDVTKTRLWSSRLSGKNVSDQRMIFELSRLVDC